MVQGKRILNIDQTALCDSIFHERSRMPNFFLSKPMMAIDPRITMMTGIDNHGEIYYSLL